MSFVFGGVGVVGAEWVGVSATGIGADVACGLSTAFLSGTTGASCSAEEGAAEIVLLSGITAGWMTVSSMMRAPLTGLLITEAGVVVTFGLISATPVSVFIPVVWSFAIVSTTGSRLESFS